MSSSRILLAASALFLSFGWAAADDKADAQAANRKARQEARQKAKAEAEAKAKADEEAKAKAEAAARAKKEADELAKRKSAPKGDPLALAKRIDEEINKKLTSEKIPASPKADDAEFLRRIYLDLTGTIPPADKAAAFIDSSDANKRAKLIDELLAGEGFGRHMADIWDNLLFLRTSDNRAVQREPLTKWLEEKFNAGVPWDMIVTDVLTATGTQEDNGAATYFLSTLTADKMVDSTTRVFMGIKMECAQCHNHPFTGWKQNEYWGMAAFFMKVRVQGNPKNGKGATPDVNESGRGRQRNLPESAKTVPAKFFHGEEPKVTSSEPLRPVLAKWLTSPDNKYFSRAWANRVWGQMVGSGIINPIDDMHEERVASHPELLAELSKQFAASGFDVKFLYRAICNSEAYQRTSRPAAGNEKDATLFSHMAIKAFTPEQLYDSLVAVLGEPGGKGNPARGGGAGGKGAPRSPRDQFVAFFSPGESSKATDYEEGIPQALRLMNHPYTSRGAMTKARDLAKGLSKEKAIEKLYLSSLSRRPSADEMAKMQSYIAKTDSPDAAYADILWALMNSSEFTLNH
jgi:hypothetical protein